MGELSTKIEKNELVPIDPKYGKMLSLIADSEREIAVMTTQYGKSHSQFQYNMLDCAGPIAGPTKIRNLRQILAVIDRTKGAIEEAVFKVKENKIKSQRFYDRAHQTDPPDELLLLKAEEYDHRVRSVEKTMAGAVRKLASYCAQMEHLSDEVRKDLGKGPEEPITEEDFEKDEERFHIMKCFEQSLIAARASGGRVDHGNMIYMHDVGISGLAACEDILRFLHEEAQFKQANPDKVHELFAKEMDWLERMYDKYKGCAQKYAEQKGMIPLSSVALLGVKEEDEVPSV